MIDDDSTNSTMPHADDAGSACTEQDADKPRQHKRDKRDVHGWVVLDKPVGMTSTHAVAVIKRLFTAKRAGHAGTLDPLASGLPADRARRGDQDRSVRHGRPQDAIASPCAGARSATPTTPKAASSTTERRAPDARTRSRRCCRASPARSCRCRRAFPPSRSTASAPMTSPATARWSSLKPGRSRSTGWTWSRAPIADHAVFEAECGKGTYVRALARDFGRAAGLLRPCFGAAADLGRPVRRGRHDFAGTNWRLCAIEPPPARASLADALLPVETALDDIPALAVSRADAARLQRGQAVLLRGRDAPILQRHWFMSRLRASLIALAETDRGEIVPKRVFNLAGLTWQRRQRQRSLTMSIEAGRKAEVIKAYAPRPATPVRPKCRSRSCPSASPT